MDLLKYQDIESKIIEIRGYQVIIDSDVASLYGVETKYVYQAVKNNPKKIRYGYLNVLINDQKSELVKNFDRFASLKHSSVNSKSNKDQEA